MLLWQCEKWRTPRILADQPVRSYYDKGWLSKIHQVLPLYVILADGFDVYEQFHRELNEK